MPSGYLGVKLPHAASRGPTATPFCCSRMSNAILRTIDRDLETLMGHPIFAMQANQQPRRANMANITRIDPFDDLFRGFFVRPVEFNNTAPVATRCRSARKQSRRRR
jgi:hypothetical protein